MYSWILYADLSTILFLMIKSEYGIHDGYIPSYLFHNFQNLSENSLSDEIKINISLSRIEGTLLYAIDKSGNQIIVTLYEELGERMKTEFQGHEYYVKLSELCGCTKCRYKPLEFKMRFNGYVSVRCNNGIVKSWEKEKEREILLNKGYQLKVNWDNHQASMWIVNTPLEDNYYPNNEQLSGCIHDISYNGLPLLNMQHYGKGIENKCHRNCSPNICNGGMCYETFIGEPFCDCNATFLNGPYCNKTGVSVLHHRIKSVNQNFQFREIKISWRSNSTEIFYIHNESTTIKIITSGKELLLFYQFHGSMESITTCIITKTYENFINCTLNIMFTPGSINLRYSDGSQNVHREIPVLLDLSQIFFTSMSLLNGTGMIDAVYKTELTQYKWITVDIGRLKMLNHKNVSTTNYNRRVNNWKEIGYKFELEDVSIIKVKRNDTMIGEDMKITERASDWKMTVIIIESLLLGACLISILICLLIHHCGRRKLEVAMYSKEDNETEASVQLVKN